MPDKTSRDLQISSSRGQPPLAILTRGRLIQLVFLALAAGALWFVSRSPAFLTRYVAWFSPAVRGWLSRLTGGVSFSLAEVFMAGLLLVLLLWAGVGLVGILRGRRPFLGSCLSGLLRLLLLAGWILVLFYALWGLNYVRPPLAQRLGWQTEARLRVTASELENLALELVDLVNKLDGSVHLAAVPAPTSPEQDRLLDEALARVGQRLNFPPCFGRSHGPVKPALASSLMSALGITGFYFPWTGEANVNQNTPPWQQLHARAHEKVHQRGITGEDEANFLGFLACAAAADPHLRYAGYLFAQRQLLMTLELFAPDKAQALVARRHPRVQADVDTQRAFWRAHQGLGTRVSAAVNDRYLRLNQVPDGILSYGRSATLMVLWARSRGGRMGW